MGKLKVSNMSFCMPGITHCEEHMNPIDLGYVCEECEEKRKLKDIDADKMFEELGYSKKQRNYKSGTVYEYECEDLKSIDFMCQEKSVKAWNIEITMQELKAINKKCEELGWI